MRARCTPGTGSQPRLQLPSPLLASTCRRSRAGQANLEARVSLQLQGNPAGRPRRLPPSHQPQALDLSSQGDSRASKPVSVRNSNVTMRTTYRRYTLASARAANLD
jgi:hypothetical protein